MALLALALATGPSAAAPAGEELRAVERDLQHSETRKRELEAEAARLQQELTQLQAQTIAAAGRIRQQENILSEIESELDRLQANEMQKMNELARRRSSIAKLLEGLTRVGLVPTGTVLFQPGAELDRLRAAGLLGELVQQLDSRAAELRMDLAALTEVRRARADEQKAMGSALAALQNERQSLRDLHAEAALRRKNTLAESQAEAARAKELAETARDLRALVIELDAAAKRRPGQPEKKTAALTKPATLPATGRIARHFGETSAVGTKLKGLEIETRQEAQVVAPAGGRVVFAGPFRGYGLLLIIAESGGYHVLLSGFTKLDCEVGQPVLAGEPVGQMGGDGSGRPTLYMEVRQGGEPIDPLPWIAAGERKVSG